MSFEQAKEKAVKYIGISKKTCCEVRTKLKKLGVEDDIIEDVIFYLKDLGYLDDTDYVKAFVRQSLKMEKLSIFEIKQKLLIKGIDKDLVKLNVDNLYETDYEERVVSRLLQGKLSSYDEEKRKNYLYRKGFRVNE